MFNGIDIPTLHLCSLLGSGAYALVFLWLWLRQKHEAHLLHWTMSALLYAMTMIGFELLPTASSRLTGAALFAALSFSNVLIVSGIRQFEGKVPFRAWMLVPIAAATLMYAVPRWLADAGLPLGWPLIRSCDSMGLAISTIILALGLLRAEPAETEMQGKRIAGTAMLAYVPGCIIALAGTLLIGNDLLVVVPTLLDQVLLPMVNLGLLAMLGERAQQKLREAALRDPLTGSWNRAGLSLLEPKLAIKGTGVVAIDLDHFKTINDCHGHPAGDTVLRTLSTMAARLAGDQGGELARIGGDEFVAILPGSGPDGARCYAEQLRQVAAGNGQGSPRWTVSLGLAVVSAGEIGLAPAIARADVFLYRAKAEGRDRLAA
ncbi:GGDEF domain-containing protein [uncultured Sphingomonas sp.]|uniref:GGDEF domain-containing protein n=1 Tax=uncultured Sphingomonas sp. TaxID=158754 RepID=UPI0025EE695F|nr:GGDEF domain-containing protein [uncultured Sphingomonas sp.]